MCIFRSAILKRHHLSSSDVLPKFRTAKELRRHEMFGNALIQFGDEIARYLLEIRKEYFQTGSPTELAYKVHDIVRELRRISWAFPLKLKEESLSTIDRTKPLLGGPLFTSKEYPWPELGGSLAEPIAQIDLKHASRLGSVGLGAGLLQLWVESHSDLYTVRVIQSSELMVENLSALPEELSERASGFASHSDWLETKMACRIIGHQKKLVSWPDTLKSKIEDILPLLRKEHCDRGGGCPQNQLHNND